jgi:hypothetical protein
VLLVRHGLSIWERAEETASVRIRIKGDGTNGTIILRFSSVLRGAKM